MDQIPAPILLADLAHELAVFGVLDRQVHLQIRLAKCLFCPFGVFQRLQCGEPVGRQELGRLGVTVARDGRAGVDLLTDAVVNPRQNRRRRQIRVGVRAADTMLA